MIQLQGLQKTIGHNTVVDIDALAVERGQVVAIVGPPGSGRAHLFDLLIGRSRPTSGKLQIAGFDPFADRDGFSQQVGVLFAEDTVYKHRSPRANLVFYCRLFGLPKTRATEVLVEVGLADQANAKIDRLAPSLVRRLAFGRALVHRPSVLLLVEPFAKCDQATIGLLSRLVRVHADAGTTVLILDDDAANLRQICDTIHVLAQSRVVETYQPQQEQPTPLPFKIPVRMQDKVALVNPGDVLYALAQEGRAFLHTTDGRLPTQVTLSELEERLARSGFFRAHRGYLVNLQHVKEVIPYTRNSFSLILDDAGETEIPLSKAAAGELRELLGY